MLKSFENNGHRNGRKAWIEHKRVNGGMEIDESPAQVSTQDGKFREARCRSVSDAPDFVVRLDAI